MNEDQIKYRRCSTPGCEYKEPRGLRQGSFIAGKFVCDACYWDAQMREHNGLTQQERKEL